MSHKTTKPNRLTLHKLLVALSYWGSSVRILLIGFLALSVLIARVAGGGVSVQNEIQAFIYIVGSLALLDIGYVMLARALKASYRLDIFVLLFLELLLTIAYIVPAFAYAPGFSKVAVWTILIVVLTLGARTLLGLLFGRTKR